MVGQSNQVRIIAGKWRGRKITFADADGLRPTGDRVRETLFNWLQKDCFDANCLDCFAGSGALGFEALSRGAKHVTFIEHNSAAVAHICDNAKMLDAIDDTTIKACNTLSFLEKQTNDTFDLVLLDPPYNLNLLSQCLDLLEKNNWLTPDAHVYFEHNAKQAIELPEAWQTTHHQQAGQVIFALAKLKGH